MYRIGEYIIYGGEGVCRVEAVGPAPGGALDLEKTYYTLAPVYSTGKIYAPTDVCVRMRPVLGREAALELIRSIPQMQPQEQTQEQYDQKKAALEYQAYLKDYECVDLVQLIRKIYFQNKDMMSQGKFARQTDDRCFRRAKELLHGELAIALDVLPDEVESVILRGIEEAERGRKPAAPNGLF